jgi:hypothetical protein
MPAPSRARPLRRQTHRPVHVEMEHIQATWTALHLGGQSPCAIPQLEETALQYDLVSRLLHLPEADDISLKARDVLDSCQSLVSTSLALDQDRVTSLYVGHRSISKMNGAVNPEINLREHHAHARHVVGCT